MFTTVVDCTYKGFAVQLHVETKALEYDFWECVVSRTRIRTTELKNVRCILSYVEMH